MKMKKLLAGAMSVAMTLSALTILPVITASAEVLVDNQFERNYDGWYATNPVTDLEAGTDAAYQSGRGMKVVGRSTPEDGAESEKGFYLEGGIKYDYSMHVKADTDEHYKLKLTWRYPDNTTDSAIIAEANGKAGQWTTLSTKYKAPAGTVNLTLTLTTDSTNDFCFDGFKVTGKAAYHSEAEIQAYAADAGLKDMYANYFRVGTCMPNSALNNNTIKGIILKDFNSVTCENELKPEATLVLNGSTDNNIKVSLNSAAGIIDFCINNNIAMRGHTFVWHSQTPYEFFKQGFSTGGATVSVDTMNTRMESYIKNMFAAIANQYPDLNLYAYDVCNECVADGSSGGPRQPGNGKNGGGLSAWVEVYGGNSFIENAFTYAKKYRPDGCKLFYNDYNEYESAKMNGILNILKNLKSKDLIDGMGMQSHITRQYTSLNTYLAALHNYADAVGCVHITELDIDNADADFYGGIMSECMQMSEVEAFVVWGTTDNTSWRSGTNCLLYDGNGQAKAAYNKLASLVPESEWGDGDNPVGGGGTPVIYEPDENGCYFYNTFEQGETESWDGRGDASVKVTSGGYESSNALLISGRTKTWNGGARGIRSNPFKPGGTYSFGAMVKYTSGEATEQIKMTLQYDADGTTRYDEVATVTAAKGEWKLLSNTQFTIPEGATGMLLYVETPDDGESLIDITIDNAWGGIEGAAPIKSLPEETTTAPEVKETLLGDVDCNGTIDVLDAVMLARVASEDTNTGITDIGKKNADVTKDGSATNADLTLLLKYLANKVAGF
ncbi:MAG: endo-1,4-beta-xylanase [Oscillospiraceae bacterium]|nr:endo-1,4-beta-xylanase [Oscillospiraceae bacterium]